MSGQAYRDVHEFGTKAIPGWRHESEPQFAGNLSGQVDQITMPRISTQSFVRRD